MSRSSSCFYLRVLSRMIYFSNIIIYSNETTLVINFTPSSHSALFSPGRHARDLDWEPTASDIDRNKVLV